MNLIKFLLAVLLVVWASFVVWRKWREEHTDEEIFGLFTLLLFGSIAGGLISSVLQAGKWTGDIASWGVVIGCVATAIWWSRQQKWDAWETLDGVTPVAVWIWAVTAWTEGVLAAVLAVAGLGVVATIRNYYRGWRWYRSGKVGLVFMGSLWWFALSQIIVAFFDKSGIYWLGLTASQWINAYCLAFATVAIYWRSGRKIKEDIGLKKVGTINRQ